jgi:hypothetical protein
MALHEGTTAVDRPEVLDALRAAAQAKGSPLTTDELHAVYASVGEVQRPSPAENAVDAAVEAERLRVALSAK